MIVSVGDLPLVEPLLAVDAYVDDPANPSFEITSNDLDVEYEVDSGGMTPLVGDSIDLTDLAEGTHDILIRLVDYPNDYRFYKRWEVPAEPEEVDDTTLLVAVTLAESSATFEVLSVMDAEYQLDGGSWTPVVDGEVELTDLDEGEHTVSVRLVEHTEVTHEVTWTVAGDAPVGVNATLEPDDLSDTLLLWDGDPQPWAGVMTLLDPAGADGNEWGLSILIVSEGLDTPEDGTGVEVRRGEVASWDGDTDEVVWASTADTIGVAVYLRGDGGAPTVADLQSALLVAGVEMTSTGPGDSVALGEYSSTTTITGSFSGGEDAPSSEITAPTISNLTPNDDLEAGQPGALSSSYSIARYTPVEFDLTDIAPGASISISIKFANRSETYTILDFDGVWQWPFDTNDNTIGNLESEPVHVTLLPRSGWPPVPWEIKVAAVKRAVED